MESDLDSLTSDIKKALEPEDVWDLNKRPFYDPLRLLKRAGEALEEALSEIQSLKQDVASLKEEVRDLRWS